MAELERELLKEIAHLDCSGSHGYSGATGRYNRPMSSEIVKATRHEHNAAQGDRVGPPEPCADIQAPARPDTDSNGGEI